jgi:integration host factor subunit beta
VPVPAKHVPHFKAGKELRERVDGQTTPLPPPIADDDND